MGPGAVVLLLGKLLFALAGVLAGLHLVHRARAESGWGVHALAAAAIFTGGLSMVLLPAGQALGPGAGTVVAGTGELLMRVAIAALWVFVWQVFRPGSAAAGALVAAGIAALVGTLAWDLAVQPDITRYDPGVASAHAVQLALALPFVWASLESARAWTGARRRLALGLSDPMTCERFRLWALATALLAAVCGLGAAVGALDAAGHVGVAEALRAVRGLVYVPIAGCVWLGVAPPAWFAARVARRSPAPAP